MKRILLLSLMFLMVLSNVTNAKDIYVWTRETSQGAVYELYVREESCRWISDQEISADIITIRTDKWGRTVPPLIVEWHFVGFDNPVYFKRDKTTGHDTESFSIKNDAMVIKIYKTVKGILFYDS